MKRRRVTAFDGGQLWFCYFFSNASTKCCRARRIFFGHSTSATAGRVGKAQQADRVSEQAVIRTELHGPAPGPARDFAVGAALVQPSLNRISIDGRIAQVEPKVMQVLILMASRPGTVIAREVFLETVWAGTTGDDYLLNRAVSELRKIFGDDAQAPRYIETIRKTGYRLVAPTAPAKVVAAVASEPARPAIQDARPESQASRESKLEPASEATPPARTSRTFALGAIVGGAVLSLAALVVFLALGPLARDPAHTTGGIAQSYDILPLTSFVGRELDAALSSDGSRVAFVWDGGEAGGAFDVYVKTIGSEAVLNLTGSAANERYPVWSADGRFLLFSRLDESGAAIMRVSALGGAATRAVADASMSDVRGMSLSAEGEWVAYAGRPHAAAPFRIVLASLETGEQRVLTTPEPGSLGDIDPMFSRDGRSLVFVRGVNEVTKDLYVATLAGEAPQRITFDNRKINGLAWSPDGERLLFTSTRSGMYSLWSVPAHGGEPQLATIGDESVQRPVTAPGIAQVAFEEWIHRAQLRRIDVTRGIAIEAGGYAGSTRWDSAPSYSPDGARIAFTSNRSGPPGIWISDRDGRNPVQIAHLDGAFIGRPAWSPDGRSVAFDASPEGQTSIFVVAADGGAPRRVTTGPGDSRNASWSRDGAWIYFESNRSGAWRIYAQPAAGGKPTEIAPGVQPRESIDGAWLLYAKPDTRGLWRRPRASWHEDAAGLEESLFADLAIQDGANWVPGANGVYFVRRPTDSQPTVSYFDYARRSMTEVVVLSPSFEGWGLDLSPDGQELVLSELLMQDSDLRLAVPRG
jgi:Tol biopolymer transport system component/DNA-binding winged helix-turn-helix (wHTH) protein